MRERLTKSDVKKIQEVCKDLVKKNGRNLRGSQIPAGQSVSCPDDGIFLWWPVLPGYVSQIY